MIKVLIGGSPCTHWSIAQTNNRETEPEGLCKDCKHLKYKQVGYITTVYWCGISKKKKNGLKLGVHPWLDKPHPKCPIAKVRNER